MPIITLRELSQRYADPHDALYEELLTTEEWKLRRLKILQRDNYTCLNCNRQETYNINGCNGSSKFFWVNFLNERKKGINYLSLDHTVIEEPIYDWRFIDVVPADRPYKMHVHHN